MSQTFGKTEIAYDNKELERMRITGQLRRAVDIVSVFMKLLFEGERVRGSCGVDDEGFLLNFFWGGVN